MNRFFYAEKIVQPEQVIPHLAKKQGDWRRGYSAYELAHRWLSDDDIPSSVRAVLDTCSDLAGAELVEAFFEREVDLRTAGRPSQTDLLALIATPSGYGVIAVEGKVKETFGPLVSDWLSAPVKQGVPTKRPQRLAALCEALVLEVDDASDHRYQLLHRCVSAIYEAERYRCDKALMLVHSFCPDNSSFKDFQRFAASMGTPVNTVNSLSPPKSCKGIELRLGWVKDQPS